MTFSRRTKWAMSVGVIVAIALGSISLTLAIAGRHSIASERAARIEQQEQQEQQAIAQSKHTALETAISSYTSCVVRNAFGTAVQDFFRLNPTLNGTSELLGALNSTGPQPDCQQYLTRENQLRAEGAK